VTYPKSEIRSGSWMVEKEFQLEVKEPIVQSAIATATPRLAMISGFCETQAEIDADRAMRLKRISSLAKDFSGNAWRTPKYPRRREGGSTLAKG
jgi:hypothetical protein